MLLVFFFLQPFLVVVAVAKAEKVSPDPSNKLVNCDINLFSSSWVYPFSLSNEMCLIQLYVPFYYVLVST